MHIGTFIHANHWSTQFFKNSAASRIDSGVGSKLLDAISYLNFVAPNNNLSVFWEANLLGFFEPDIMDDSIALRLSLGATHEQAFAGEKRKAQFAIACKCFAFALVGGSISIEPQLILLVRTIEKKILAVVPTSIILFSGGVAFLGNTKPANLFVATAVYGAVLAALIKA